MKRWILTIDGFTNKPLVYANTSQEAKAIFDKYSVLSVDPYFNEDFLSAIDYIKSKSELMGTRKVETHSVEEWYKAKLTNGELIFGICKDIEDERYFDIVKYQIKDTDNPLLPLSFTCSDPTEVKKLFFLEPLKCEIPIYRVYGEPKMSKPKELRGIKSCFSVEWNNKCKCQCFAKGNDLWIKHRDFFSQSHIPTIEDMGTPLTYRLTKYFNVDKSCLNKFVYPDSWGEIVLRNEAWIVFRNIKSINKRNSFRPANTLIKAFIKSDLLVEKHIPDLGEEWYRFFEMIYMQYKDYIEKNEIEESDFL